MEKFLIRSFKRFRISVFLLSQLIGISNFLGAQNVTNQSQIINEKEITSNVITWWTYHKNNIIWSSNFIPTDNHNKIISKDSFYKKLIDGDHYVIKNGVRNDSNLYQIRSRDTTMDNEIFSTIKNEAAIEYNYYKWEGKSLPEFNFKDLSGNVFDSENTKGKIIVLNCWFTHCSPCVAEIPELNSLVKYFKKDKSIIFLAPAFDDKSILETFIQSHSFSYTIIPEQENYLRNVLNIYRYPTHIIVDRQGKIKKISTCDLNTLREMILKEKMGE
jgi:thiol-disulfide isomerase/thioredoxin